MAIVSTILKNTLTHTVVKLVGSGSHTLVLADLIDTVSKESFFSSGTTVIQLRDPIGVVVGGKVSGTGIAPGTVVTEIHDHNITISSPTTADAAGSYIFDSQVANTPVVNIVKTFYDTDITGGIAVTRDGTKILSYSRSGVWQFDGFSISEKNQSDIVVTLSGSIDSTLILELRKSSGYSDNEHPFRT